MKDYFKNVWLGIWTALIGMRITIDHLFRKNVTVQYPNVHPKDKAGWMDMPSNARNRLYVDMDECNGCNSCARACPVNCISIETVRSVPGDAPPPLASGGKRNLWVSQFEIDFTKCCFCSLCTEACPTGAIVMTTEFEYSSYNRYDLVYNFVKLQNSMSDEKITEVKEKWAEHQKEKKKEAVEPK